MGTKKFKLSDMIPNAWFYKLKDMNKTSKTHHIKNKHNHNHNNHLLPPPPPPSSTVKTPPRPDPQCSSRKSYYVARELTIDLPNEIDSTPPRKSARSRKSNRRSSSISTCSIPSSLSPPFRSYQSPPSPPSPKETDILGKDVGFFAKDALLDVHKQSILSRYALADEQNQPEHFDIDIGVDRMSLHTTSIDLPPIITKQKPKPKPNAGRTSMTINSPGGVRLRMNSPRIVGRKQGQNGHKIIGRKSTSSKKRRSISESFAVVKTSFDPQGDFKKSMVEMVLQNNLTAAKDLEDLLACYLSLNSDEYHDVIIKVFKQIWIDLRRPQ